MGVSAQWGWCLPGGVCPGGGVSVQGVMCLSSGVSVRGGCTTPSCGLNSFRKFVCER